MCSGTGHPGLAVPRALMEEAVLWLPGAARSPLPLPGEHGVPETHRHGETCPEPLPFPPHPPGSQPTCGTRFPPPCPGPQTPSTPVSSISESLLPPHCQPHAKSSLHCIIWRRHRQPGASTQILQAVRYLHVFHVSSSLKTILRTTPSKTPLKGASPQQALQRHPLVSGSPCPRTRG